MIRIKCGSDDEKNEADHLEWNRLSEWPTFSMDFNILYSLLSFEYAGA